MLSKKIGIDIVASVIVLSCLALGFTLGYCTYRIRHHCDDNPIPEMYERLRDDGELAWVWNYDKTHKVRKWQLALITDWSIWNKYWEDVPKYIVTGKLNGLSWHAYSSSNMQGCVDYIDAQTGGRP